MLLFEQIQEYFNQIDTDKNGVVDMNEFITAFKNYFPEVPEVSLKALFRVADDNSNGELNF